MARRDPHDVLGVPRDAGQSTIKAAWRRLAREHHPDLTPDDPAATERATRRMAEINRAYAELRAGFANGDGRGNGRVNWPPKTRPTRPVTGRVDTSATFRPRNTTTGPGARHEGRPPLRADRLAREPLRASQPNGPLSRRRQRNFRPPEPPSLEAARGRVIEFGKFHGHRLGEIADFEPTYIDWLARTISRDPDLVAAARVIQEDLDGRDVVRQPRPSPA
jgi:curved DNA-binding protein CbpA